MVTMDKKQLRKGVRARLSAMTDEMKRVASQNIVSAVKERVLLSGARVVALFSPLPDEPQISSLLTELSVTMVVAVPRVEGDIMQFYRYSGDSMCTGSFGIEEPQDMPRVEPCEIDLMVVPGVAFTKEGARMGRGKGFYDKYMSREGFCAYKIGICYSAQVVDELPQEEHDIKMDCVIYR